jgi:hypothetical protein
MEQQKRRQRGEEGSRVGSSGIATMTARDVTPPSGSCLGVPLKDRIVAGIRANTVETSSSCQN